MSVTIIASVIAILIAVGALVVAILAWDDARDARNELIELRSKMRRDLQLGDGW